MAVGTKVLSALAVDCTRLENSRQILLGDTDAGVGLSVFEQHIIARVVTLDEAILEQQRVFFGVDHSVGDVADFGHQPLGLEPIALGMEVRRNTALQPFGFSHVNDGVVLVIELITARFLWLIEDNVFESCQ